MGFKKMYPSVKFLIAQRHQSKTFLSLYQFTKTKKLYTNLEIDHCKSFPIYDLDNSWA